MTTAGSQSEAVRNYIEGPPGPCKHDGLYSSFRLVRDPHASSKPFFQYGGGRYGWTSNP
jgi:hypothetical protein